MAKRNITLRVEEELLHRVRQIAVVEKMSVSAWMTEQIERAVRERDPFEADRRGALAALDRGLSLGGKPPSRARLHVR